jgi:hypothetical protein
MTMDELAAECNPAGSIADALEPQGSIADALEPQGMRAPDARYVSIEVPLDDNVLESDDEMGGGLAMAMTGTAPTAGGLATALTGTAPSVGGAVTGGGRHAGGAPTSEPLTNTTSCECARGSTGDVCVSDPVISTAYVAVASALAAAPAAPAAVAGAPPTAMPRRRRRGPPAAAAATSTLPSAETAPAVALRQIAARVGCDSESCVLRSGEFRRAALAAGVTPSAADRAVVGDFKPAGPRATLDLLSNFDIDSVLRGWARLEFPEFYPCPFAMMDFDKTHVEFDAVDMGAVLDGTAPVDVGGARPDAPGGAPRVERRHCSTFGCVLNTDTSRGPGKHWVAAFVDCRAPAATSGEWSVEYFNSAGRPPPPSAAAWLERRAGELRKIRAARAGAGRAPGPVVAVPVTAVDHQQSQTECGLYALHYIRARLEGIPWSAFVDGPTITDEAMTKFRAHVFRVVA